eukprot:1340611-Rhodomonas_salina.2
MKCACRDTANTTHTRVSRSSSTLNTTNKRHRSSSIFNTANKSKPRLPTLQHHIRSSSPISDMSASRLWARQRVARHVVRAKLSTTSPDDAREILEQDVR